MISNKKSQLPVMLYSDRINSYNYHRKCTIP